MMKKVLMGVALLGLLGQAHAADQQTNQPIPLADPGKTGPVPCYIMALDKNGKWDRVLVRMHGKNPGGAIKDCTDLNQ